MASFIPNISASSVAAVIGKNRYKSVEEAMYEIIGKDLLLKKRMYAIANQNNRRFVHAFKNDFLKNADVKIAVIEALASAETATDMTDIMATAKSKAEAIVEEKYSTHSTEIKQMMVDEVRGQIARQRGSANETKILDTYEAEQKVVVTERNTRTFRKSFPTFNLVGRTDGYVASENRIVDSKDRVRFISAPPIYDEIQLRVYMNMSESREAELVERFPNGTSRVTRFLNDAEKWQEIEDGLTVAAATMQKAVEDDAELTRIIFANTVAS
jgi:hypothetical protein